jgi:hypothetical protein
MGSLRPLNATVLVGAEPVVFFDAQGAPTKSPAKRVVFACKKVKTAGQLLMHNNVFCQDPNSV